MIRGVYPPPVLPQDAFAPFPPGPSGASGLWNRLPRNLVALLIGVAAGLLLAASGLSFDDRAMPLVALGAVLAVSVHGLLAGLLARRSGLASIHSHVGVGRWIGSLTVGGQLLVFRLLPLVLFAPCRAVADLPDLRRRLWRATAVQFLLQSAISAALVLAGGPAAALGWGLGAVTLLTFTSRPHRVTSPAWRLLRLPFGKEEARLDEWRCDPAALAAARAQSSGRLDLMRAALTAAPPSGSPRRQALWAGLALAEGRYGEATYEAVALLGRSTAPSLRAEALHLYACALSDGIRTGLWPADQAMPHFTAAAAALRAQAAPAVLRRTDLGAREAYFQGDYKRAVTLAARAAATAPEALSRSMALNTLAVAHTAAGRPRDAARAAARASALLHR
ncbi:conserved membrane hypothetical protein [Actinacidiphila cocklensis]|uniref:Uncharacterized protein n=1 Tax=Actinacidiphila cocklensis TaxID=887465 RepID=A0A9W4DGT5_9ACTN|nr:conserved membrane hypothetical protein [Actinacidiphila cocklensis]